MNNYFKTFPKSITISIVLITLLGVGFSVDTLVISSLIINAFIFPFPDELNAYIKNIAHSLSKRIIEGAR